MNQNSFFATGMPAHNQTVACDPKMLSDLILQQWHNIEPWELQRTHYNKHLIALLIEEKYGIGHTLTENYLSNLERTLPIAA